MHTFIALAIDTSYLTAVYINLGIFIFFCLCSALLLWRLNFGYKGYKLLFLIYTLFWIPLMLLRAYTGTMATSLGLSAIAWLPLAAYGFIGIFARLFADWFAFLRHNRKGFIYLALFFQLVTYIPIICAPSLATNIIQSLGVGLGASCIGSYQLLFNEQYGKAKQFLTVSILSIPPLLADFISSPIQSIVASLCYHQGNKYDPNVLRFLWLIGLVFVLITFIILFFYKENRSQLYKDIKYKQQIRTKPEWIDFILIAFLGSLIAFVKFANSGAIATNHIQWITSGTSKPYEGYISVVFSVFQLIGGLITGLILVNRLGKFQTFSLGCITWIIYEIGSAYIHNVTGYFAIHALNGLSYGIIYNLILGSVLQKVFSTKKQTPMGVYQSVLSIGIMCGTWFSSWMKATTQYSSTANYGEYWHVVSIINWTLVAVIVLSWIVFSYCSLLEKWKYQRLWFNYHN